MQYKITNEQPFQVLCSSFSISPSQQNYTLNISADGKNYSPLFTVASGQTRLVTGVASGSYYKLVGNQSEVTVNWVRSCNDGGGGSGSGTTYTAGEYISIDQDVISVTGITPDLYLTTADTQDFATEAYVDAAITSATQDFVTEAYVDAAITSATQDFATQADITAATSPIEEHIGDVERVTASALTELHQDILDLSGATPDLSNYYTKQETDTQIADAIADIPQPDLSNYYTKDQIAVKEEVVSRALNDLHNDVLDLSGATPDLSNYYTKQETDTQIADAIASIPQPDLSNYYTKSEIGIKEEFISRALNDLHNDVLDLSGATPDLSNYYTSAQTEDAIDEAISAATADMKTYTDNRIDGYDSAVTLTKTIDEVNLRLAGSTVCEAGDVGWAALGRPRFFTTNIQQYDLGNAPYTPDLGTVDYLKFNYVGESDSVGEWTGVYYALPADGEFVEGVPVQLTRTTEVPSTIYNTPAGAGSGDFIWDNVNLTITWKSWKRQPVIEQHIPGVVKSDGVITKVKKVTQAEYDAITTPDASTLYIITNS